MKKEHETATHTHAQRERESEREREKEKERERKLENWVCYLVENKDKQFKSRSTLTENLRRYFYFCCHRCVAHQYLSIERKNCSKLHFKKK